ncbi:MAG: SDR family NAD(P)-dependent oxidoreductase [Pseudolysinimonas sp.]
MVRVALVTGATSGIGRATAMRLSREGWRVVINGVNTEDAGRALSREIPGSFYVDADVADPDAVDALIQSVVDRCGRIDLVVNSAGIARRIPHEDIESIDPTFWQRIIDVNLTGTWNVCRSAAVHMRAEGGQIVNVASIAGLLPAGSSIPYSVSKAGVVHLTKLLAKALGPHIIVNAVAPGFIDTTLVADAVELRSKVEAEAPLRRIGTPDDVASVISAILSMRYVTGAVIPVDGGFSLV